MPNMSLWDPTLNEGKGSWRAVEPGDLGGSGTSTVIDGDDNVIATPPGFAGWPESIDETDPDAVTITRTDPVSGDEYVQTITVAGAVTTISAWVLQS